MTATAKSPPQVLPVRPANIPHLLKDNPQWVGWKVGKEKPGGRYDKLPTNMQGDIINAHDPCNWMTFDQVCLALNQGKYDGIGFDLNGKPVTSDAEGNFYLVGIDIDGCVTAQNGKQVIEPSAEDDWIRLGRPYREFSPSGTGIRMFVLSRQPISGGNRDHHEMYCNGRFLTITGHGSGEIIEATGAVLDLHREWFPDKAAAPRTTEVTEMMARLRQPPPPETERELERLKSALEFLSADTDRDTWRNIVWAIAATGWSCAEGIAREWSQTAPSRYTDDGFDSVWNSFSPKGGITIATAFHLAKQAGWVPTHSDAKMQDEGDILNGKLFADAYLDQIIFIHETSDMLSFSNNGWTHSPPGETERLAKLIVSKLREEAAALFVSNPDDGLAKRKMAHATKSSVKARLDAMIALAKSEPGMTVRLSDFDADPYLLGVRNGIFDLRKRQLLEVTPEHLISMRAGVEYAPQARCPKWISFLSQVQPDKAVQRMLQQLVGVFLSGDASLQKLIILYGLGANGKSTFIELVSWLLGDYGVRIQTEMLLQHQRSPQGPSPDIVSLKGRRMAYCNEVPEGSRLDDARVKELTGGDTLTGRTPYAKTAVTFAPTHNLIMVGNHRPEIHDMSHGMWRRVLLIPFEVTIPEPQRDPKLLEKLKAEGSGILNWAVAGFHDIQRHGLRIPRSISGAVEAYKNEEDLIGEWLEEHFDFGAGYSTPIGDAYWTYQKWALNRGHKPLAQTRLTRRLKERGVPRDSGKRNYLGLKMNEAASMRTRGF